MDRFLEWSPRPSTGSRCERARQTAPHCGKTQPPAAEEVMRVFRHKNGVRVVVVHVRAVCCDAHAERV